jgi:glucose-1-phosphate thymidylyltransferase
LEKLRKIKTLILAAGYGTRLYPLTRKRPKPLIRVGGRPILNHILTRLRRVKGMKKVVIVTNDKYSKNFHNWARKRLGERKIKILNDGSTNKHESLGAIADIDFGLRQDGISEDLLVLAGDNIFDFPINPFIKPLPQEGARVGLYDVEDRKLAKNYGIVDLADDNRITDFVEKPSNPPGTLASMGMYLLTPESQQMVKKYITDGNDPDDIGLFIAWLKDRLPVYGHVFKGRWFDIGDHGSLNKARNYFEP